MKIKEINFKITYLNNFKLQKLTNYIFKPKIFFIKPKHQ